MIRRASNLVPYFVLAAILTSFFVWLKAEDTAATNEVLCRMTQLAEQWQNGGEGRQKPLMVDVRSVAEFEISHCEGAINIPNEKMKESIFFLVLDRKTPLFVYSRSVRMSAKAVDYLKKMDYEVVHNLNQINEEQIHKNETQTREHEALTEK